MTPVDQEFLHKPEDGQHGDCMRACIASVLDLPISEVPHFAQLDAEGKGNFWLMVAEFCAEQGYSFVTVPGRIIWTNDEVYHIISGPSPRRGHHAVVGRNGQIVFDPHPSRAGLAGDPKDWHFDFLVRPTDALPPPLECLMPKDLSQAKRIITQLHGELSTTKALLHAALHRKGEK